MEPQNQLHSFQYRQYILHIIFIGDSTPLSINTLLEPTKSFLENYLLSGLSGVKTGRSGDLFGAKRCPVISFA